MAKSPPEKLARALRANLKRRKPAPPPTKPVAARQDSPQALIQPPPQPSKKPG